MKKERSKRFKYDTIIFFIKIFISIVPLLPRKLVLNVFSSLGSLAFRIIKKERINTINNLTYALGDEYTEKQIHSMADKVFRHQAKNLADYIYTLDVVKKEDYLKYVEIEGEENLKDAYESGSGAICLTCHVGSWEFSAITPSILGYHTVAVSKALRDPKLNNMMVGFRQKRGLINLNRGGTYEKILKTLKDGHCLLLMIDQDTKTKSTFVDFFGKQAYTPVGAAMLALETGAKVLPMAMYRTKDEKHKFVIKPEIPLVKTGDYNHDLKVNTANYSKSIEEFIRRDPSQWVWMHRRWKSTPEIIEKQIEKGLIKESSFIR